MTETNTSGLPPLYVATLEPNVELPSPQQFYDSYVQPRRPVLIRQRNGALLHNPHILTELSSSEKLLELVGSEHGQNLVEVNVASSVSARKINENGTPTKPKVENSSTLSSPTSCSFSPQHGSRVVQMSLTELCSKLSAGSTEYYMTTQTLPLDEEGRPAVYNWLTKRLIQERVLPVRPALLGHLIPMNVANVWMGRTEPSKDSQESTTSNHEPIRNVTSSSGLHHDMHDNLYCLLLGKKTLRVAPPATVHSCKMVGRLHTLHENGRIVYHEQLGRKDQLDKEECPIRPDGALRVVERIVQLELQKEAIERQLCAMDDSEEAKLERDSLEEQLDFIQEELLDIEMADNDSEESDRDDDDCQYSPGALVGIGSRASQVSLLDEPNAKRAKHVAGSISSDTSNCAEDRPESTTPPNFAMEESRETIFQTLHLNPGDALYLPAGWFHEVFSVGDSASGLHIAINYWMHPPDVGRDTCFKQPYRSMFWKRDWDARRFDVDWKQPADQDLKL